MENEDAVDLDIQDFRRLRRYLAPHVFALHDDNVSKCSSPSDLIPLKDWEGILDLPTDVALRSTSLSGSTIHRLCKLHNDWIWSWPSSGKAPFMEEVALIAGEEFDAAVFAAIHGWYRQAIGGLRNALETLAIASSIAVRNHKGLFEQWRSGEKDLNFGNARECLRDSKIGKQIEVDASPFSIFGDGVSDWLKSRYERLCSYAHGKSGYDNRAIWESNGPVYVPGALEVIEIEFRETIAICYLRLRIGWKDYTPGQGQLALLNGSLDGWDQYGDVLKKWLLA